MGYVPPSPCVPHGRKKKSMYAGVNIEVLGGETLFCSRLSWDFDGFPSRAHPRHHHHSSSSSSQATPAPGPSAPSPPRASASRHAGATPRTADAAGARTPRTTHQTMMDDGLDDGVVAAPETGVALAQARAEHEATAGQQARRLAEESDTDADSDAAPAGAGVRGVGDPLDVGAHERRRVLCDGAGLCSLGLWPPWRRPDRLHPQLAAVRALLLQFLDNLPLHLGYTAEQLFDRLAAGLVEADPFGDGHGGLDALVNGVLDALSSSTASARPKDRDLPQPVRIRALQQILALGGDPDHQGMEHYCRGVRLGVECKLPRTPAVFARKRRWRLEGQGDPSFDAVAERLQLGGAWRENYEAAIIHQHAILDQLQDAVDRGLALRLGVREAAQRFPDLTVNSLNAVAKLDDSGAVSSVRLVLDGTHGVVVNRAITQRDQDRCPVAGDVRRVQREQSLSRPAVGLALDVREAHRLPRVHPDDWKHQGCRSSLTSDLFVFVVGCFGVSSAAYWWARLGGAIIRAVHLLALPSDELWILLMADDVKAESTGEHPKRAVILVVLILVVLGVPLSWQKSQGGDVIRWIGYEVHLATLSLGITERRAAWCVDFLLQLARDGRADVGRLRSGLGRLCFVVGALEWERPFLAPLFAFVSKQPKLGHRALPLFVRVIAQFMAARISLRRLYPSAISRNCNIEPFRIDASAEGDRIGVGGWLPFRNRAGKLDPRVSPWFSFTLDRSTAPWAYYRGLPFRSIAALEAVAVLVALLAFHPFLSTNTDVMYCMRGLTDNRGNQFALSRLQTSRFPLCAVVMEIAARSELLRLRFSVDWIPREMNAEADALADGDVSGFSQDLRCHIHWPEIKWIVLDWALEMGEAFYAESRASSSSDQVQAPGRKRRKVPLRQTDPWSRKKKQTNRTSKKKKNRGGGLGVVLGAAVLKKGLAARNSAPGLSPYFCA